MSASDNPLEKKIAQSLLYIIVTVEKHDERYSIRRMSIRLFRIPIYGSIRVVRHST